MERIKCQSCQGKGYFVASEYNIKGWEKGELIKCTQCDGKGFIEFEKAIDERNKQGFAIRCLSCNEEVEITGCDFHYKNINIGDTSDIMSSNENIIKCKCGNVVYSGKNH